MATNKQHKKRIEPQKNTFLNTIIKNKKGLLGETALGNFISSLFHIMPKPLLFLIFLAIILLITQLFTYIFNFAGIYCNSADVPVTVGFNLITTIELMGAVPDKEQVGLDDIPLNKMLGVNEKKGTSCSIYLTSGTIVYENGTTKKFTNRWFYDGTYCTKCEEIKIYNYTGQTLLQKDIRPEQGLCEGDVFKQSEQNMGWFKKWQCDPDGAECEPPSHYYYNYRSNTYVCNEPNGCGKTTIGQKWDDKLKDKGATLLYPELNGTRTPAYNKMTGIQCINLRPKLTIYGIDIFDYKIWVALMFLTIMVWLYFKLNE